MLWNFNSNAVSDLKVGDASVLGKSCKFLRSCEPTFSHILFVFPQLLRVWILYIQSKKNKNKNVSFHSQWWSTSSCTLHAYSLLKMILKPIVMHRYWLSMNFEKDKTSLFRNSLTYHYEFCNFTKAVFDRTEIPGCALGSKHISRVPIFFYVLFFNQLCRFEAQMWVPEECA